MGCAQSGHWCVKEGSPAPVGLPKTRDCTEDCPEILSLAEVNLTPYYQTDGGEGDLLLDKKLMSC